MMMLMWYLHDRKNNLLIKETYLEPQLNIYDEIVKGF